MNIGVVGCRNFDNYDFIKMNINEYLEEKDIDISTVTIISGGAIGVDTLGEKYANEYSLNCTIFRPNWKKYGKGAGMMRNTEIVENSDVILAFWDGQSKGTHDTIKKTLKFNKKIKVFYI